MPATTSTANGTRRVSVGIDLGIHFAAVDIFEGGRFQPVESPLDGSQIEMVVYHDPKTGKFHIGNDAILRSYVDEGDNLFLHAKRNIPKRAETVLYGGQFTPVQIFTEILRFLWKLLVSARPEPKDYPQFGGKKRPADELAIIFTVPANWSIEQQKHYETAILAAGFTAFDGFIAEPIAAARRLAHVNTARLKDGERILVVDIGAGTTDIAALEYRRGVFHQVAAASGDGYLAGLDFTNPIAARIAAENDIFWEGIYSDGGLNLSEIPAGDRPRVMGCWFAGEEAKKHLSVIDEATVAVEFPTGRRTFSITRDDAAELWKPVLERFQECIAKSLEGTKFS